jgi:hypothetical protein
VSCFSWSTGDDALLDFAVVVETDLALQCRQLMAAIASQGDALHRLA